METFSKLTLASVSVLALLTLAACGNSKDKTDSSSSAPSSSTVSYTHLDVYKRQPLD